MHLVKNDHCALKSKADSNKPPAMSHERLSPTKAPHVSLQDAQPAEALLVERDNDETLGCMVQSGHPHGIGPLGFCRSIQHAWARCHAVPSPKNTMPADKLSAGFPSSLALHETSCLQVSSQMFALEFRLPPCLPHSAHKSTEQLPIAWLGHAHKHHQLVRRCLDAC